VGAAGVAWYGADSLRHRRESGHGYDLRGEIAHDVASALCERASAGIQCNVLIERGGRDEARGRGAGRHGRRRGARAPLPAAEGRASYDELVAAGVEVYECQPTMLHAKTMTVDGCWSAVGSANFDNRSFQLHDEAVLCVSSEEFAARLAEQFERDLEVSERIAPGRWLRRGPVQRAGESALKLARREL
jgi:phosphatidylserine/phosphatidylglycerophosphate/cardiolipin synthase-like enzyme